MWDMRKVVYRLVFDVLQLGDVCIFFYVGVFFEKCRCLGFRRWMGIFEHINSLGSTWLDLAAQVVQKRQVLFLNACHFGAWTYWRLLVVCLAFWFMIEYILFYFPCFANVDSSFIIKWTYFFPLLGLEPAILFQVSLQTLNFVVFLLGPTNLSSIQKIIVDWKIALLIPLDSWPVHH